jgi:hypothetical protein
MGSTDSGISDCRFQISDLSPPLPSRPEQEPDVRNPEPGSVSPLITDPACGREPEA